MAATLASLRAQAASRLAPAPCRRLLSTAAAAPATARELSAKALRVTRTTTPKPLTPAKDLVFGRTFTDHMLTAEWDQDAGGWQVPRITPYQKLQLDPSCTVFHYGMECFEGLKAYKDAQGRVRLFRPDMNMARLWRSCERLALPTFDKLQLLECIKQFVKCEERWIPRERGYSLYVRPTMIGTQASLGVGPSSRALMFTIASPVGPYFRSGFTAVSLLAQSRFVRAWPGGTGDAKVGGNYAPTIRPQVNANAQGYQQILWLFGPNAELTEVGTMNVFVFWKNAQGERELVTPMLDGTILPGVTRDSILGLARKWGEFKVAERKVYMREIVEASQQGRLLEMFGAGTACIVCPIKSIHYDGKDLRIPLDPKDSTAQAGPLTKRFNETILGIQYGEIPHEWSVVVD